MKNKIYILILFAICLRCGFDPIQTEPAQLAIIVEKNISGKLGEPIPISVSLNHQAKDVQFLWSIDGVMMDDTTYDTTLIVQWFAPDTFVHTVTVRGFGRYDQIALPETAFVNLTYSIPQVSLSGPSRVSTTDTAVFVASGLDSDGVVEKYLWSVDPVDSSWFTSDSVMKYLWDKNDYGFRTVRVCGIDNSGLKSQVDSVVAHVLGNAPVVALSISDTLMYTNRELKLWVSAHAANGYVDKYVWSVDGKQIDTAVSDTVVFKWDIGRELPYRIVVTVTDNDSVWSSDTVLVTVKNAKINLTTDDSVVYTGDRQTFVATPIPSDSTNNGYLWYVDGVAEKCGDTLYKTWGIGETGMHTIITNKIEGEYNPDTLTFYVNNGDPKVVSLKDTVISSEDTLVLPFTASDTNGTIEKYLWGTFSGEWVDSSDTPEARIAYNGSKEQVIVWGARDNSGLIAKDTVVVKFNYVPELNVIKPLVDDTIWFDEKKNIDTVRFEITLTDRENDSLSITVYSGTNVDSMKQIEPDSVGQYGFAVDKKGMYYWRVAAKDSFGNMVSRSGEFVVMLRHTICFGGHSIVAGVGGDDKHGGFRKSVLDGMRNNYGEFEAVKAVGPLVTPYMSGEDDSCFAYSGSIAEYMLKLMRGCQYFTADMWVWMLGTNYLRTDNQRRDELKNFVSLLDNSHKRNPDTRLYVVNCIPFDYGGNLYNNNDCVETFNSELSEKIDSLKTEGFDIHKIDIHSLWLDENGEPNSLLYGDDDIHPNQVGYEKFANEILRVIKENEISK